MTIQINPSFHVDPADLPGEAVIFGSTNAMHEIRNTIDGLLCSDLPVLLQGDSGTGKEVVARFLHSRSNRQNAPFVRVNCAAIPSNLLETELFGSEKAFNALEPSSLLEIADGGTLFLDEIGSLPWDLQGKLLQLIRDGCYIRAGGNQLHSSTIRVICATNINLQGLVSAGEFREDLLHHMDASVLRLSALRHRKSDIPQLCEYLFQKLSRQFGRKAPQINPETICLLQHWDWPGNLRELENWVARAIVLGDEIALGSEFRRRSIGGSVAGNDMSRPLSMRRTMRRGSSPLSSSAVLRALQANRWNRRKTADDLNMSYRALLGKLREAGVLQRRRSHKGIPPI